MNNFEFNSKMYNSDYNLTIDDAGINKYKKTKNIIMLDTAI